MERQREIRPIHYLGSIVHCARNRLRTLTIFGRVEGGRSFVLATVRDHIDNIFRKIGVDNRVQLVNLFR